MSERAEKSEDYVAMINDKPYLNIKEWSVNDIECEKEQLGLSGFTYKSEKD